LRGIRLGWRHRADRGADQVEHRAAATTRNSSCAPVSSSGPDLVDHDEVVAEQGVDDPPDVVVGQAPVERVSASSAAVK
jgi:hypothetical protein